MSYLVQIGNGVIFAGPFDVYSEAEAFATKADESQEYNRYSVQVGEITPPTRIKLTPFPERD